MSVIKIENLTRDYGKGCGIFDLSFEVQKGESFALLGPNGAGKTTAIRHLMGFISPQKGHASILGADCFLQRELIQKKLGYLPGEIAFMDEMTGRDFLKFIAKMKEINNHSRIDELCDLYKLDPNRKISKMSKGTKQKIGLVCAFMNNPEIVILDEPTSGLDPLMQKVFIQHIIAEKKKGTTFLISSHIFEEIEKTCDKVAVLKNGRLIAEENMEDLKNKRTKSFEISFYTPEDARRFTEFFSQKYTSQSKADISEDHSSVKISFTDDINLFIKTLSDFRIKDILTLQHSLEELFLHFYQKS